MECDEGADKTLDLNSSTVSTTPKLSKKERKALLASRKSFEKSLKNVITNPYPVYWPLVEKTEDLFESLEVPLKTCWIPNARLQLSAIKGKSREERQALRKKAVKDAQPNVEEARKFRSMLAIGLNAVFRALERQEVEAVLVANDIDPKFMAQHLIQLASQQSTVIVVRNLRQLAKSTIGAESAALAFKCCTRCEDNPFFSAVQLIKEKALRVPKPATLPDLSAKVKQEEQEVVPNTEDLELKEWQEKVTQANSFPSAKTVHSLIVSTKARIYRFALREFSQTRKKWH
ncbi:Hypothetical predicted protein [Cloeon dipterum]|uniref:Ribosomal protein eL8/eL30/eS12/Gadd45 domain-containing protein n=1 Tax=Cloeon dipterum TaxID=197152 RepID=A0A8S1DF76_9INSE|nr:Hypothetical predicted protein [Cloeon dipterum]